MKTHDSEHVSKLNRLLRVGWVTLLCLLATTAMADPTLTKSQKDIQEANNLDNVLAEQSGTAIHIVFDDSGSMEGAKIQQAKAAFQVWLDSIPEDTKLSLTLINLGTIVPLEAGNREKIKAEVEKIDPNYRTPLVRSFLGVANDIQTRRQNITPYERHIMIIFTDGVDSEFPNSSVQKSIQNVDNAQIETVGIGFHGEGDYMNGYVGKYFNASDQDQLTQALENVSSEIDQNSEVVISPEVQAIMDRPAAEPSAQMQEESNNQSIVGTGAVESPGITMKSIGYFALGITACFVIFALFLRNQY